MTAQLRRALGLVLALSLSVLTVFEAGDCCRPAASEVGSVTTGSIDAERGGSDSPAPDDVCPFPCAPTGCRAIMGCAPAALTEAAQQTAVATDALHTLAQSAERPLASRVSAPEPPPPRA